MIQMKNHIQFASIRANEPIDDGDYMCESTLMAIMGREACYSGKEIKADDLMKSDTRLGPETYEWGDVKVPAVAMPGRTKPI